MKIDLSEIEERFEHIFSLMSIDVSDLTEWIPDAKWTALDANQLQALSTRGIDIKPDDIDLIPGQPLEYRGEKVVLYIRDSSTYGQRFTLPKFHISFCSTLQSMHSGRRYNRYVVSRKEEKEFLINRDGNESWEDLDVCKNCLNQLNYNGYDKLVSSADKENAVRRFNLGEFFKLGHLNRAPRPIYSENNAPRNEYTKSWTEISTQHKQAHNWTCQKCKLNLSGDRQYLQTHHIDGSKNNNAPGNLKVLCVGCHANEPFHSHMKSSPIYLGFKSKY